MNLELIENNPKLIKGKQPILFIHGMWHGAWCWESNFLSYFEELGYKGYALSFSNHANSARRKAFNLLRISDYVADLKETIDRFDIKPILIAHSMGGFVVQKYLEKHKLPGVVLLSTVPPFGIWNPTFNVLRTFPFAFLKANLTLNLKHIIGTAQKYKKLLCSDAISDESITTYYHKTDTESFLAYIDMLGLNLVKSKKIKSPLLMIRGENDHVISEKIFNKTCKLYGVTPIVFEEMGHNIMLEPNYKLLVHYIEKWITEL